ncbi:chemotaxis protein CheD [Desulfobaculum xiamenense]|uniref:Probable chemoreceptor glutamine deamidase CheD n=1 Tax=Desulfobaculum xiamenense TaxID=995050 RepID=A0A846QRW8_9BACT|nr:chemotaxis protein CheD [Desulfobaculum xiamenense]
MPATPHRLVDVFRRILASYPGLPFHNLGVGEAVASCEPSAVTTVLGSCVAVTFHCPRTRCGAIFHALLPSRGSKHSPSEYGPYRFADEGVRSMAERMKAHGCALRDLECKVFGGANALFAEKYSVAVRNAETAVAALAELGIRPCAIDVGGTRGRKLFFLTHTGEVFIRRFSGDD